MTARMYPPEPVESNRSSAERRLFSRMQAGLSADWHVLHSVGIADHPEKVWGEIDFVLIGPAGIYCLEVKGGRVTRQEGIWQFTDRHGQVSERREGPFEQAQSGAQALRGYLTERLPWIGETVVGWGTAMPDIVFSVSGPDIEERVLYDERDEAQPFAAYARRLADFWHGKIEARRGRPVSMLNGRQILEAVELLRGDFDLRPSLRARVNRATEELLRLTNEQFRVLDGLRENPRVMVTGGAGTGKTVLAVEEARRAAREGKRVLLSCFNRRLGAYLREACADVPRLDVYHLHGLMAETVREAGLEGNLPEVEEEDLFTIFYPELTLEALLILGREGAYDVLVVDEGQDLLLDTYVEVFDELVTGGIRGGCWRWFRDPNQDIFEGTGQPGLKMLREARPAQYELTINCRNTRPIATTNWSITGVGGEATLRIDGPDVAMIWYEDEGDQRRQIGREVNRVLSSGIAPEAITILSRYRRMNSALREKLPGVPYRLSEEERTVSLGDPCMRYATVGAFKGLESDVVVLADVDDLESRNGLLNVYVGASRARAYLVLCLAEGQREQYRERMWEFGREIAGRNAGGSETLS